MKRIRRKIGTKGGKKKERKRRVYRIEEKCRRREDG